MAEALHHKSLALHLHVFGAEHPSTLNRRHTAGSLRKPDRPVAATPRRRECPPRPAAAQATPLCQATSPARCRRHAGLHRARSRGVAGVKPASARRHGKAGAALLRHRGEDFQVALHARRRDAPRSRGHGRGLGRRRRAGRRRGRRRTAAEDVAPRAHGRQRRPCVNGEVCGRPRGHRGGGGRRPGRGPAGRRFFGHGGERGGQPPQHGVFAALKLFAGLLPALARGRRNLGPDLLRLPHGGADGQVAPPSSGPPPRRGPEGW